MAFSIKVDTFGDIVSVVENRAKIAGEVQERDRDFIKAAINEYYVSIATERPWRWRSFNRAFNFNPAITTGTVEVTQDSREVTFTGLVLDETHKGRSLKITGTKELYRIIGINTNTNQAYLDASFVGSTNAVATFKLYQYEFPLPPDLDQLTQVYIDTGGTYIPPSKSGELDFLSVLEFNRYLSNYADMVSAPTCYNQDGLTFFNTSIPPLDEMILDYDFLGGEENGKSDCLRLFPIEPFEKTVVKINYSVMVTPMVNSEDIPLIPVDDRWVLVHYALAEWNSHHSTGSSADREFAKADGKLKDMREEYVKTAIKPRFMVNGSQYGRVHGCYFNDDKFRQARMKEYS